MILKTINTLKLSDAECIAAFRQQKYVVKASKSFLKKNQQQINHQR